MEAIDIKNIYTQNSHKTRVLIIGNSEISELIKYILEKADVNPAFISQENSTSNEDRDFIILESQNIGECAYFKPNIVLLAIENSTEDLKNLIDHITAGGILIFNENLEAEVKKSDNYFRQIPYGKSILEDNCLITELGNIPLSFQNYAVEHLEGIKLFCQQFSIMEDEFYEILMSFDNSI